MARCVSVYCSENDEGMNAWVTTSFRGPHGCKCNQPNHRHPRLLFILTQTIHCPVLCVLKGYFFLYLQNFFYTSKLFLNFQKILWPIKKIRRHHTLKIMSTSGSQNIWLPEVKIYNFRKSKYITGSRFSEIKNTSESQNVSPEVDFRK